MQHAASRSAGMWSAASGSTPGWAAGPRAAYYFFTERLYMVLHVREWAFVEPRHAGHLVVDRRRLPWDL